MNKIAILTCVLMLSALISCSSNNKAKNNSTASKLLGDSLSSKGSANKNEKSFINEDDSFSVLNLQTANSIKILSLIKEVKELDTSDSSSLKCQSWDLSKRDVENIFKIMSPISSEVRNLAYSYLPCRVLGEVQIDGRIYKYWLNAGSTLTLSDSSSSYYYACSQGDCSRFFITGEDSKE